MTDEELKTKQHEAKAKILERSIDEDQEFIAEQWLQTFKHNEVTDPAILISKLMLACIAVGDFQTRSSWMDDGKLTRPPAALKAIDYLSHASRIIIDYQGLNESNKNEFLGYFPKAGEKGVVSRSATHAVTRNGPDITELKGMMLGLMGVWNSLIGTPYDFGVNIAMGGKGQSNLVGNLVDANGFSGHVYFHHQPYTELMMVGLEQTAPAKSLGELIWGHSSANNDYQNATDQFGQGHSNSGASDTYTAAGSLYFSDPVYQGKLLCEKGIAPPDKYGAMQIKLSDDQWELIKGYLSNLSDELKENKDEEVRTRLKTEPRSAVQGERTVRSYIALDFGLYLDRISLLLDGMPDAKKDEQLALQENLRNNIVELQAGNSGKLADLYNLIEIICAKEDIPASYVAAINRIRQLFEWHQKIDKNLKQIHLEYLIAQESSEVLNRLTALLERCWILKDYFSSNHISQENGVAAFLENLDQWIAKLAVMESDLVPVDPKHDSNNLASQQSALEQSWLEVVDPTEKMNTLKGYQDTLENLEALLNKTPRLISESAYEELQKKYNELEEINSELLGRFKRLEEETKAKQVEETKAKQAKIDELSNVVISLKGLIGEYLNETKALKGKNKNLIQEANNLKAENERLQGVIREAGDYRAKMAGLKGENAELSRKANNLNNENQALKAENQKLKAENDQLQGVIRAGTSKIENLELQIGQFRDENQRLTGEISKNRAPIEGPVQAAVLLESQSVIPARGQVWKAAQLKIWPIQMQLDIIKTHGGDLKRRGYNDESNTVDTLVDNILDAMSKYQEASNPSSPEAINIFKRDCQAHINKAKPILAVHRGWKQLLGNLLACVLGLGIGYVAAASVNYLGTGNFLFFNETASLQKLKALDKSLDEFAKKTSERAPSA